MFFELFERSTWIILLTALLTCAVQPQPSDPPASIGREQARKRKPVEFISYRLSNGLRILLSPNNADSAAAVNLSFDAGTIREDVGNAGSADLVRNAVLRNLRKASNDQNITFEGVIHQERTSYSSQFSSDRLDQVLSLLSGQIRPQKIDQAFIDEHLGAVRENCRQLENSRFGGAQETLLELMYRDQAFRYGAVCRSHVADQLLPEEAEGFLKNFYTPNNAVLVIVGNFNIAAAQKTIVRHFGPLSRRAAVRVVRSDRNLNLSAERRAILSNSTGAASTYISAYLTVPSDHPDWYGLNILADIIGQGEASRLHTALVKKNLASSVPEGLSETRGRSHLRIGVALLPNASVENVEKIVDAEIARIQLNGVTKAEIEQARTQERRWSAEQLDSLTGRASFFARAVLYYNDPNRVNTELERILSVNAKDVQRVAQKYLVKTNRAVIVVNPASRPTEE